MRHVCKNPPGEGTKPLSAHRLKEVPKHVALWNTKIHLWGKLFIYIHIAHGLI